MAGGTGNRYFSGNPNSSPFPTVLGQSTSIGRCPIQILVAKQINEAQMLLYLSRLKLPSFLAVRRAKTKCDFTVAGRASRPGILNDGQAQSPSIN